MTKRFSLVIFVGVLLLAACAPPAAVQQRVLPTLVSVTVAQDGSRGLLLQGRYFGDGQAGQGANSYVILGANINAEGGVVVQNPSEWSDSRIRLIAPAGTGHGYVFVVVAGERSNGLPANLP